mmetsp:Transcript_26715/g.84622  ORF Transcript_26715/g.84622 Transcript_26715/m.84622 type:complete len:593 (+) Transcript_26715:2-1780(+)
MEAWGPPAPSDSPTAYLRLAAQAVGQRWTVDPPLQACEAAGLEVAVRAWWRGVPGRRARGRQPEDVWLRSAVSGGTGGKARARLQQRLGIPAFVIEGGLQLGRFLQQDCQARQTWWNCQQEEVRNHPAAFSKAKEQEQVCHAKFVAKVVEQVHKRYDVRAEAWLAAQQGFGNPCLILAPHTPSAPSTPRPSGRRPAHRGRAALSPRTPVPDSVPEDEAWPAVPAEGKQAATCETPGRSVASTRAPTDSQTPAAYLETPGLSQASESPSLPTRSLRSRSGRASVSPAPPSRDAERAATPPQPEPSPPRAASAMAKMVPDALDPAYFASLDPEQRSPSSLGAGRRRRSLSGPTPTFLHEAVPHSTSAASRRRASKSPSSASPSRRLSRRLSSESNFDRWMTNVKQCITHRKEAEESRAETEKMMMQERPPLLFAGGRKATQRVVRDIQKVTEIFKQFDRNQSGVIEPHEFMPLLATLLQQPQSELDKEEVWKTWKLVDEDGSNTVSFDEFHKWYCGTFAVEGLTDFRDFIKEDMVPEEQRQMREVAAKLGIDIFDIEKIWKEFKAIDTDSSGLIDYEEFKVFMQSVAKLRSHPH